MDGGRQRPAADLRPGGDAGQRHVLNWLTDRPEFANRYAQACEALMDWYSEEILRIAFDFSGDLIIDGARVMSGHHVLEIRAREAPRAFFGPGAPDAIAYGIGWLITFSLLYYFTH